MLSNCSELNQLIDECLTANSNFEKLNLPKLKNQDDIQIEFDLNNCEKIKTIDLLNKFPIMESDYIEANLTDFILLNGQDNEEDENCKKKENAKLTGSDLSNGKQNNIELDKKVVNDEETDDFKLTKELKIKKLDQELDKRNLYEVLLEFIYSSSLKFDPGDSIGILIGNYDEEVNELIDLLNLNDKKHQVINIVNLAKNPTFPKKSTLFQLIKYAIEIRAIPKKVTLLQFSEFCTDQNEKICLRFLSSKEGSKLYDEFILGKHFGILDLLKCFKTCKPNLKTFLANSVNFIPRYYSIIEHFVDNKLKNPKFSVKIAFNLTQLPSIYNRTGTQLFGIFTGQMNEIYENKVKKLSKETNGNYRLMIEKMNQLSIDKEQLSLYIFKRKNLMFKLSYKFKNIIMISIGTGLTPFMSLFNQINEIKTQKLDHNTDQRQLTDHTDHINIDEFNLYLIHGCRTKNDCLYLNDLNKFKDEKIINHLKICYSRVNELSNNFKYVQDYLKTLKELKNLILNEETVIYVCGDQIKFTRDVFNAFVQLIDEPIAEQKLKKMQKEQKYLQDFWL